MSMQEIVDTIVGPDSTSKWLRLIIVLAATSFLVFMGFVVPVNAGGATQISGVGYFAESGECVDDVAGPNGQAPAFALKMTGDLEGCHYVFVESSTCLPSGVYREMGTEIYVGAGGTGDKGTFRTTYRFEAKYEECTTLSFEIHGRCQHPIIGGSGTGNYEGVSGRLDFKDDIEAGNFPYRGHLR